MVTRTGVGEERDVKPYKVAILGATGLVGQRFVQRLAGHPWFTVGAVAASSRSAGKRYDEAVDWKISADPPEEVRSLVVRECEPDAFPDCDLALSGLDSSVARDLEPSLVERGLAVVSNSSAYRMRDDVPLLVPEVNASHLGLLDGQLEKNRAGGFLVTNPNCSVTGLALALAPLHRSFGVRRVVVATMQALSGAGLGGPRGLDAVENVIPFIPSEEEKMEIELAKIFGSVRNGVLEPAETVVSAHCHRVPTIDGHLEAVSVELARQASLEEVARAMREFVGDLEGLALPSAPGRPVVVREEPDRPQPRLDRDTEGGMAVVVGRLRPCPVLSLRFVLLSHNTARGAAGGALLNAELLARRDLIARRTVA